MATCSQSGQEFIRDAFSPTVGVIVSDDAKRIAAKNDLSFVELLRPFCQLPNEVRIRDPVNPSTVVPIKKWKLRLIDLHSESPPPLLISRILNEIVSKSLDGAIDMESIMKSNDSSNARTPWFEAYREAFFQLLKPTDHEFIRHILACILVVSSNHSDPMSAFTSLSSEQSKLQQSGNTSNPYIRWFSTNTFKYFVLLHDSTSGENAKADAIYQSMSSVYGSNACYLLKINSKPVDQRSTSPTNQSSTPDPWEGYYYPFAEETFDIDESEEVFVPETIPVISEAKAEENEEIILNELEEAEKRAEEQQSTRSNSFQDPLSMHYEETLADISNNLNDLGPLSSAPVNQSNNIGQHHTNLRNDRAVKYKKSLQQFTFSFSGSQTNLGQINKPKGHCLIEKDHSTVAAFIHEFATRGLLPHIEKLMRIISEQNLSRKGIHRSLFSATKKWFGSNKGAGGKLATGLGAGLSYPIDSPELNNRKLGDLAFLVQHYDLAYSSYHSAKREFNNDHAWAYFAGALEMAAISAFMQGQSKNYPVHYFEACISTYLNTCRMQDYATRSCLMSTEALKSKRMYADAAFEFIKLTSEITANSDKCNEKPLAILTCTQAGYTVPSINSFVGHLMDADGQLLLKNDYTCRIIVFSVESDLRSALLLEQAAHCYLRNTPSMGRKFAFHMILAGHRFSKATQRKHTLRCNATALKVYHNKGWHMAEDHVNFIAGRQSFTLGLLGDAANAFKELLYASKQQPSHQLMHLREYLTMMAKQDENDKSSHNRDLPVPHIDCQSTRLLLSAPDVDTSSIDTSRCASTGASDATRTRTINAGLHVFRARHTNAFIKRWSDLERATVECVKGSVPYLWKAYLPCLNDITYNAEQPKCICGEMMIVELLFCNPLLISIHLQDIQLLWEFAENESLKPLSNIESANKEACERCISTEIIRDVVIKGQEKKPVCLRLTPTQSGDLNIIGVAFTLNTYEVDSSTTNNDTSRDAATPTKLPLVGIRGQAPLNIQGPRLNSSKEEKSSICYGNDKRLHPRIIPEMPLLQVAMVNFPITILCGEIQTSTLIFKNTGKTPLQNLHIACNYFQYIVILDNSKTKDVNLLDTPTYITLKDYGKPKIAMKINLLNEKLDPGEEVEVKISIRGLPTPGVHELDFLFYYEPMDVGLDHGGLQYRILQQMVRLQTLSTLTVGASISHCQAAMTNCNDIIDTSSGDPEKELILTLKIENRSQGSSVPRCVEFDLQKVVAVSNDWKLKILYNQLKDVIRLRPGECSFLHFSIARHSVPGGERLVSVNNLPSVSSANNEKHQMAVVDFLLRSDYYDANEALYEHGIGIVLLWQTSYIDDSCVRHVVEGQTHDVISNTNEILTRIVQSTSIDDILPSVVKSSSSNEDHVINNQQLISAHLRHDNIINANFANNGVCFFDVNVILRNHSPSNVDVELSANSITLHSSDRLLLEPDLEITRPAASSGNFGDTSFTKGALWNGPTKLSIKIGPNEKYIAKFSAIVVRPGLYDVNNFTAFIADRSGDVRWSFIGPSIVCARNSME